MKPGSLFLSPNSFAPKIFVREDISLNEFIQTSIAYMDKDRVHLTLNNSSYSARNGTVKYEAYSAPINDEGKPKKIYLLNNPVYSNIQQEFHLGFNKHLSDCYIIARGGVNKKPYVLNIASGREVRLELVEECYSIAPQRFKYRIL